MLLFLCLLILAAGAGCDRPATGTSDNLRADYDRVVKERDGLKADFEKQKGDLESLWQQKVDDREQKIAGLTMENANLRQRLLVADAAGQDVPLVDAARARSIVWLHVTYVLIVAVCLVLVMVLLWVHVNLRERVRDIVLRQAQLVPTKEICHVQ